MISGRQAMTGLDALAVDPDLAGAQQSPQPAVRKRRVVTAKPTIEAKPLLVRADLVGGPAHVRSWRKT